MFVHICFESLNIKDVYAFFTYRNSLRIYENYAIFVMLFIFVKQASCFQDFKKLKLFITFNVGIIKLMGWGK